MTRCYYCDEPSDERICQTCSDALNRRSRERLARNAAWRRRRQQDEHIEVEARGGRMEEHRE